MILDPMPGRRVIDFGFFLRGGASLDPAGESGIAHFVEHAVFRGAGARTGREISRSVDARGGYVNAYTDKETLWIACEVLAEEAEFALDLLADLVARPRFPEEELLRERDVVVQEAESAEEDGEERVRDLLDAALWPGSAYARPVVGLPREVHALTPERVRSHYRRLFRPETACLAVAGGFDPQHLACGIERRLASWETVGLPAVLPPSAPGLVARTAQSADLAQVHLGVALEGRGRLDPLEPALRILATLLGGGASSRLFEHLREDEGLCYAVDASHTAYRDRGIFAIYLATSRTRLDRAAEALAEELARVADGDLADEEVERAQAALHGAFAASEEQAMDRVERLAEEALFGRGPQPFETAWDRLARVTPETVRAVARMVAGTHRARFVALGPVESGWRPRRRGVA